MGAARTQSRWTCRITKSLPIDGIGANEYLIDVVHDAVDFISTVDTPAPFELNIWYHTLNCGYRTRKISGETDFPCIYGERVGLGRVLRQARRRAARLRPLVRRPESRPFLRGRRQAVTSSISRVERRAEVGKDGSQVSLENAAGTVKVTVRANVAAFLDPEFNPDDCEGSSESSPLDA